MGIGCVGVARLLRWRSNNPDCVIEAVSVLRGVRKGLCGHGSLSCAQRPAVVQQVFTARDQLPCGSGKAASESKDGPSYE